MDYQRLKRLENPTATGSKAVEKLALSYSAGGRRRTENFLEGNLGVNVKITHMFWYSKPNSRNVL